MELIDQTIKAGAREKMACQELGISQRTLQRWRAAETLQDQCQVVKRPTPKNKLTKAERDAIIAIANSELFNLLFAPLGRELGGFSEWIFEVDPFIIAGELEQPQNIRWDIVRQMALYMVIIGQIDNLNRVEHIQQYTGCWAV